MSVVIGIDSGGSTTKIVGFREADGKKQLIQPLFIRATDPVTSIYGAFGKFITGNSLSLADVDKVLLTGAGASHITGDLYGLPTETVPEFTGIGLGGLYLSGLSEAIVVSMGTGTALIHAKEGKPMNYLGGTGVGGGTVTGLAKRLIGVEKIEHLEDLVRDGDLSNIDLMVGDITKAGSTAALAPYMTAANFGKVSDMASHADLAKGVVNMVFETIGMMAIFAARMHGVRDIVLTGNLTSIAYAEKKFHQLSELFAVNFRIPENARFGTAIGCALCG